MSEFKTVSQSINSSINDKGGNKAVRAAKKTAYKSSKFQIKVRQNLEILSEALDKFNWPCVRNIVLGKLTQIFVSDGQTEEELCILVVGLWTAVQLINIATGQTPSSSQLLQFRGDSGVFGETISGPEQKEVSNTPFTYLGKVKRNK